VAGPACQRPRQPMAACPSQHMPTHARRCHGDSATAWHLMSTLSTDHCHLPSMWAHAHRRLYPLPCRSCSSFEHFNSSTLICLCLLSCHTTPTAEPPASPHLSGTVDRVPRCLRSTSCGSRPKPLLPPRR
jgi:hypothetical protein